MSIIFNADAIECSIAIRKQLHASPELSGDEKHTTNTIKQLISKFLPDETFVNMGGMSVAFSFSGSKPGPGVLIRCELDALPIEEVNNFEHASRHFGIAHKCGHDGHMAILYLLASWLAENRPQSGQVILLFQSAEETGQGAAALVADEKFKQIQVDYAFALHNLPGYPHTQVLIKPGIFNCASMGMQIKLKGKTAHAAQPEAGISPAKVISQILAGFESIKETLNISHELAFVTIVYVRLGEQAYGVAPGEAEVGLTLRSETDETMARMLEFSQAWVTDLCQQAGLQVSFDYADNFCASVNAPQAVSLINHAANDLQLDLVELNQPFRWSEDFGRISATCIGAMFGFGAGRATPQLHNPDYDFPDQLIVPGASMFARLIEIILSPD